MTKSVKIVDDEVLRLEALPGKQGLLVREKCKRVFKKLILINLETFQKSYRATIQLQ